MAQSLSLLSVWVFVDTTLIIIKVNITLVQVHVAIRNTRYFFKFILGVLHFDLDYPIDFGPQFFAVYNSTCVIVVVEEYFLWVIAWVNRSKIDSWKKENKRNKTGQAVKQTRRRARVAKLATISPDNYWHFESTVYTGRKFRISVGENTSFSF